MLCLDLHVPESPFKANDGGQTEDCHHDRVHVNSPYNGSTSMSHRQKNPPKTNIPVFTPQFGRSSQTCQCKNNNDNYRIMKQLVSK